MTNTLNTRAIHSVVDTNQPEGQQRRLAQTILDTLTVVGLAQLRLEVRESYTSGSPRFLCPECGAPLFVAQNPAGAGTPADGRGAHFKHYAVDATSHCTLRTDRNLRDVGAVKFNGLAEGADHASMKRLLALCLSHDPDVTDINVERQIRGKDGAWRQPDVSAMIGGKLVAFDLQLAGAALATIIERNAFYAANDVTHVWLTDAGDFGRLTQLAFRDLHLMMGGRIFAIDDQVLTACIEQSSFQLKELSITPRIAPPLAIHNVWQSSLVGRDVILMALAERKKQGELRYRQTLTTQVDALFKAERAAIRRNAKLLRDIDGIFREWSTISRAVKGRMFDDAKFDPIGDVIAWLATVETFITRGGANVGEFSAATDTLLSARTARHWAPLIELTCQLLPSITAGLSARHKSRLAAMLATKEPVVPLMRLNASMLSVLYPWLGFHLLAKPPKFAPPLSRSGSVD